MKKILFILFGFLSMLTWSQTEDAWVYFTDKPDATYYLANPLEMLTQRALDRRTNQGIALDEIDVPIATSYVNQIEAASGITVLAQSKWLNAVHVQGLVSAIENLEGFSFVSSITFANPFVSTKTLAPNIQRDPIDKWEKSTYTNFDYGMAANQIEMLGGDFLHEQNFTGEGMLIAVIDSGFEGVNSISGFARLRNNNQILGTYNFVTRDEDVYINHYHGTMTLSTIGGFVEGEFVGTAPDADFYLFVSEDVSQEHVLEESLWVEAAEEADRLGVDVINTSLGYSLFDNPDHDHSYLDMDGATTFISRGAEIASSRGMIVVNSAGNSGNNDWHYITAPADAVSVLTVGAVSNDETITNFSSYGPSFDGRVKPDVCAQGGAAAVINPSNELIYANGTSFSSPIMAGVVTCFWQAFPDKTNIELMQIIKESADRYTVPDEQYGYGIPNFETAFITLNTTYIAPILTEVSIYPNPMKQTQRLQVNFPKATKASIELVDITGKSVYKTNTNALLNSIQLPMLTAGLYILQIKTANHTSINKKIVVE